MGLSLYLVIAVAGLLVLYALNRMLFRPVSPEQFKAAFRSRIEKKHPEWKIESELDFGFKCTAHGNELHFMLGNCYAMYLRHRASLGAIIDAYLRNMMQMQLFEDVGWDEAKYRVFPSLRSRDYLAVVEQVHEAVEAMDSAVVFDYKGDLVTILVLDFEEMMRCLSGDDLELWQVSRDEVMQCALKNLASKTAPLWPAACKDARKSGLFQFATCDGYDASRILLPDFCQRVSEALGTDRIAVAVPIRDALLAVSAEYVKPTLQLKQMAQEIYASGDHLVSPDLFFFPRGD